MMTEIAAEIVCIGCKGKCRVRVVNSYDGSLAMREWLREIRSCHGRSGLVCYECARLPWAEAHGFVCHAGISSKDICENYLV